MQTALQLVARSGPRSVERSACRAAAAIVLCVFGAPALAQNAALFAQAGNGLHTDDSAWPRWQGRIGITTASDVQERFDRPPAATGLGLFGDYYFLQQGAAAEGRYGGGFRATGGLLLGPRRLAWSGPDATAGLGHGVNAQRRNFSLWLPAAPTADGGDPGGSSATYLGVGYTGLRSLKATGGGWSFSADVGVMALQPRSVVRFGQQSVSDTLRDLQLSPLLQLGVSYSF